jgi:type IV secretion system protein VirD4
MDYAKYRSTYAEFASEYAVKSSLYRITPGDVHPDYGGIPLYADSEAVYVEQGDSHSLIIGSTGSKKTRLIGMPALQTYAMAGESFVATDPKAELYHHTYHTLKQHDYRIIVLNLRDPARSNAWNPFTIPYRLYHGGHKDKAIEMVVDMAQCIAKDGNSSDPYWENSATDLLAGLIFILFECADKQEIHFQSLRALRAVSFKNVGKDVPYLRDNFLKYVEKSSILYSLLSGTAEVTETTRSCIISVFDQALRPFFCQNNLINMLSGSDFDLSDIGKTKTAVFLIIPDENTLYNKLISVFIKQCYSELLREAEQHPLNRLPRRVNFMLDEFSSLPTISDFPSMITASRSRNIRFNLIIQSVNQLAQQYGLHADTIRGNCDNLVFLHSREFELLNSIVKLSGMKNSNESLISVSMLQTLDKNKGEAFILHNRFNPFIAHLWDIDQYPHSVPDKDTVPYPKNTSQVRSCFDFEYFCVNIKLALDGETVFAGDYVENNAVK